MALVYKNSHQPQTLTKNLSEPTTEALNQPQVPQQKPLSKEELDAAIKDYIINHPEDIVASLEGMQKKRIQESAKQAQEYLDKNRSLIEQSDTPPVLGNNNGDVSIVEFYDYACSFCKKANEYTNEIIKEDPGVKVILRPIAVLGDASMYAAKVALAVQKISPIKFAIIHNDLMKMRTINEEAVKELMANHDIDYALVENELNSYSVKQQINRNFEFAKGLMIQGTPSYVINGEFVPGMLPVDKLRAVISQVRSSVPAAKAPEAKKQEEPKAETNNNPS
jgi:protein-disulfide isomerase